MIRTALLGRSSAGSTRLAGSPPLPTAVAEAESWPDTLHALAEAFRVRRARQAELDPRRPLGRIL